MLNVISAPRADPQGQVRGCIPLYAQGWCLTLLRSTSDRHVSTFVHVHTEHFQHNIFFIIYNAVGYDFYYANIYKEFEVIDIIS